MDVFTYGSLMYRPVWERVVSGDYPAEAAAIRGFERRRVAGEVYPALVRAGEGSVVNGVLYRGVSLADVRALDRFEAEGEAYSRIHVPVELGSGERVEGWTYLYLVEGSVEEDAWEPGRFEAEHLGYFLDTYCRDRAG